MQNDSQTPAKIRFSDLTDVDAVITDLSVGYIIKMCIRDRVRCRAKGENYSYDFAASLQNTNGQSILISERDLTAWKGAAERMLTNEIVLKVFSDYLNRDTDFEVVLTSKGLSLIHI